MSATHDLTLFRSVDHSRDPAFFVRFMDEGHRIPAIQASKRLIRERLNLRPGNAVLDVGCGPGTSLLEMAETVGASGWLVGLDASEAMIAEARRRAAASGVPVHFEVGDAQALRFPDRTFDVCHTERVLMHVPDVGRVLAEMVRVTRLGGRVVAFDFDWDTLIVDSPHRETTRTIVRTFSDTVRHGWIGRQLPRRFKEHGLSDISVDAVPVFVPYAFAELLLGAHCSKLQAAGTLAPEQVQAWWDELRAADARGMFLLGFTAFVVVGTKPISA